MSTDSIIVHWRPGCMFCSSLLRQLERTGLVFERVNIWDDEGAAAFVRSVAGGNETVPTVRVGSMALVNPTPRDVLRAVAQEVPDRLPEHHDACRPSKMGQFVERILGR